MTVWEVVKSDPFIAAVIVLFVITIAVGIWLAASSQRRDEE